MHLKSTIALFFSLLNAVELFGQNSITPHDSTSQSRAESYAIRKYSKVMEDQALLHNGREYKEFNHTENQHPYFQSEYPEEGSVSYDQEHYTKVPILYDLVTDNLIIEHNDHQSFHGLVKLNADLVESFSVFGHSYRRLMGDSSNALKTGFYDFLYDGHVKVLARKWKIFHEEISARQVTNQFSEKINYYIQKSGQYFLVRGKGSVLKVLKDQKKALKQYANKNKLDFWSNKEHAIIELVTYYDQITTVNGS